MRTLYGLSQSPWTEKARWALDHHAIEYRYHEHVPVLGEVLLRIKARSRAPGTKASVPLLVDGDDVLLSSLAIARHADTRESTAESLFPKGLDAEIERWAELSDQMIGAGRSRVMVGLRANHEAQREALPPFIPGPLRGLMTPMAATAAAFLGSKYDVPRDPDAEADRTLRPALDQVRAALGDRAHILERFTFADVAIASALQVLRPPTRAPIGPATREIWTNEPLARDYTDLLTWRDALYASHRIERDRAS
jgi:glutathione S-transferase